MAYEEFKYINHLNESLPMGQDNKLFINENDLHDYSWDNNSEGGRLSTFTKGVTEKTLPLVIIGKDKEEKNKILNQLFVLGEKDVLTRNYGKLYHGDYYLKCYVTASKKSSYLKRAERFAKDTITISTDYPWWIKELKYSYKVGDDPEQEHEIVTTKRNLDYNFDYNIDYLSNEGARTLYNSAVVDSNFKLIMYGPVVNPKIEINGHLYQVNITLLAKEYVEIDSVTKKIRKMNYDGTWSNAFASRNKESYIFKRIEAGYNHFIWDGTFRFDIILYDERSEPPWI